MTGFLAASGSPLVSRMGETPSFPDERLVIIANRMFAHRITEGYKTVAFGVVEAVNDEPVDNIRHMIGLINNATGEYITFKLTGYHDMLVFRRAEIEEATEVILTDEGIRYQLSPELRDAWKPEG